MTRIVFERELQRLQDEVLNLGSEVEENLFKAVDALMRRDMLLSQQLIKADEWVNEKRIHIGMDALTLIATQQPIAGDMRLIAAVIEIVGELERIHDYIKGIAKISLMLGQVHILDPLVELLPQMATKTGAMLHQALAAFAWQDAALARKMPPEDDEIDILYKQIYREIISYIATNTTAIEYANQLEWVIHNLERSADRVTNVCEWIIYMVTGVYTEMDSEVVAPPEMRHSH